MTIYATQTLGFSIQQAGIVMAFFGAGAIVGAYLGGRITDKYGFYVMQVSSLFAAGCLFIVLGFLRSFPLLCMGTVLLSICSEGFRPANSAAIAHYSKMENRTRSYALNRLAINLGFAAGGALGGFFAARNFQLLFWVDGLTNIFAAILLLILLKKPRVEVHAQPTTLETLSGTPYKDKIYLLFIGMTILYATCFFQMFGMQPVFFKTDWKLNEQFIGVLMAINGLLIALIEMVLVYKLENRRSTMYYIQRGIILIGLGFLAPAILPVSHAAAILAIVFITLGEVLTLPFMNTFWLARTAPHNRGQYAALYTMAWSAAQIFAPLGGSSAAQYFGFNVLWYIIFGLCLLMFFVARTLDTKAAIT